MQHPELQDLEVDNPGKYIMMTFQGLWMLADSKGKFLYQPRLMKLEILPFIPFDLQATLDTLEKAGFFFTYEVKGKKYGLIPSFLEHQRINGKEAAAGEKYPDPEIVIKEKQEGSNREAPEKQQRSQEGEREEEGELGKGNEFIDDVEEKDETENFEILVSLQKIKNLYAFVAQKFPKTEETLKMKVGTETYTERQEAFILRNNERSYTTDNDFLTHYRNFILKPPPIEKEKSSGQKEKETRTEKILSTHEQYLNSLAAQQ